MLKISFNYAKNILYALLTFSDMSSEKDSLLSTITPGSLTLLHLSKSMIVLVLIKVLNNNRSNISHAGVKCVVFSESHGFFYVIVSDLRRKAWHLWSSRSTISPNDWGRSLYHSISRVHSQEARYSSHSR